MPWWLAAVGTVALVLLAAKAHGRQIRLEREQQGYFRVDFRSQNPAAVEAIWRRDRRVFWPTFAVFAGLAVAYFLFLLIVWRIERESWFLILVWLAWAFAASFAVAGLVSWFRMANREQGPLPWRRRAMAGSAGWWLAVAAAAALVAWSLA